MELTGKKVLVVGSGISGVAATELLKKKGIEVILFDGNKDLDVEALREKSPVFADVKIVLGELTEEVGNQIDLVVLWWRIFAKKRFQSGVRLSWHIIWQKAKLLQLPEQTEKLQQLH